MNIFKNKHIMIATLMAPVLAVLSYYAVNHLVGEQPHAAEAGQSYSLVEKPNCRYSSGKCGLKNGDFELTLSAEWQDGDQLLIKLNSVHPLDGVLLAVVENEADQALPVEMQAMGSDGLNWSLNIARPDPELHRLHLAASSNKSVYFGDVAMKFLRLKTTSG